MKNLLFLALTVASLAPAANSILYPRQIQPKLTLRERCRQGGEWKRYGSLRACIEEKHHEELVALEKERLEQANEEAARASAERREIRDEARAREELKLLHESLRSATGN